MNQIFKYNGNDITFQLGNGDVMVNATEMAKAFSKQPSDWTKTKQAQEFISSLSAVRNIVGTDLVKVLQGGLYQGTWMHEDVAIEFSRWLSPAFSIWCNDHIKELLKHGMTATPDTIERMLMNPDAMIEVLQALKNEREEKANALREVQSLHAITDEQSRQLNISAPKVLFADSVSSSNNTILIGDLAKLIKQNGYEIGAKRLFDHLRNNGYLIRRKGSSYNLPTQKSMELGLFEINERAINNPDGSVFLTRTTKVTGKGQIYFVNLFLKQVV